MPDNDFPGAGLTYVAIIKALVDCRKERGLFQEQIADALGVSLKTLSAWETLRNNPSLPQVCRWAAFVGLDWSKIKWPKT